MNQEFSARAIIFRKEKEQALFLIIYSGRNKIWGFPKGHIDPGESEKGAALREIREETGINDIKFVDKFRETDIYQAVSNRGPHKGTTVEKHSIYFLCETNSTDVIVDKAEIAEYKWLNATEANELLAFDSLKRILKKAEVIVHANKAIF